MRHAYVNVDFLKYHTSVLFGQTSDVFSPLVTPTLNYTVLWWSGDIGFRRNQLRVSKTFPMGNSKLLAIAALTRSAGGEDAGAPGYQARLGYTFPALADAMATVGISGHSAKETAGSDTNSVAVDVNVPLSDSTSIQGEFFAGENLDAYLGGIGQGVNAGKEIESDGYWVSVTHKLNLNTKVNLGYGMDDPDDADLISGDRSSNSTLFGNVMYALDSATTLGVELSQHKTDYLSGSEAKAWRLQLSATFAF